MTTPTPAPGQALPPVPPRRSWGQRLVITSGAIVAVVAVIAALAVGVAWWRLGSFERIELDLAAPKGSDKALNFLVVGSDSRAGIDAGDPDAGAFLDEEVDGQRTDTIIVMRVEPKTNTIKLLSIPRDLWVPINGTGEKDRINAAFAAGGAQTLIDTVRTVLDIDINHYVEVDFAGFKALVDIVGGVPMYFDRPMYDEYSGLDIPEAGCTVLRGQQALAFARARHLYYLDPDTGRYVQDLTADLGRITRQQVFARQALAKVTSLGLTDVGKLNRLIGVATDNVLFDDGLRNDDLLSLGRRFAAVGIDALTTYSLPTELSETAEGASVVLLRRTEAQPVLDVFRGLVPAQAPAAPTLAPSQIAVSVLNGTGIPGQAATAADGLRSIGFDVAQVGNAGAVGETRTTVRYAADAEAEARVLAGFLQPGVPLVRDATLGRGVVLTTGADFVGITVPDTPAGDGEADPDEPVGVAPPGTPPPGVRCP